MAKLPQKNRRRLNIFDDEQLGPKGIDGAFAQATDSPRESENNGDSAYISAPPPVEIPAHFSPAPTDSSHSVDPSRDPQGLPVASRSTLTADVSSRKVPYRERKVSFELRIPQLTKSEFAAFKARLSAALGGVALTDSQLLRAVLECLLVQDTDSVIAVAEEEPRPIRRPANQDIMAQAEFDAMLARLFREARNRSKRRLRSGSSGDGAVSPTA